MRVNLNSDECERARREFTPALYSEDDFIESYRALFVLKKRINRFLEGSTPNEKILINSIIFLFNSFRTQFLWEFFCLKYNPEQLGVIKSITGFLGLDSGDIKNTPRNHIMDDILKDLKVRYNLPGAMASHMP